jgi:hypothetical protein
MICEHETTITDYHDTETICVCMRLSRTLSGRTDDRHLNIDSPVT